MADTRELVRVFFESARTARILVDGVDSGATIEFDPAGGMQLRNLLPELPPFLRIGEDLAEFSFDEATWDKFGDPGVLIYWLLDPRRVLRGAKAAGGLERRLDDARVASIGYDVREVVPQLSADIVQGLAEKGELERSALIVAAPGSDALLAFIQKGFPPDPETLELRFVLP